MKKIPYNDLFLFSLGLTSIIYQIVILRELLSVVNGNELSIGIFLAIWLLSTGLGAKYSTLIKIKKIINIFLVFTLLPFFSIILLRTLWYAIFIPGEMIGIVPLSLAIFSVLFPFTFIAGTIFTKLSSNNYKKTNVGYNYSIETLGSMFGSILAGIILIHYFNSLQIIILLTIANLLLLIHHSFINNKLFFLMFCAFLLSAFINLLFNDIDVTTKNMLFPGQKLIEHRDTPLGNIAITKTGKQLNIFESGILTASSDNIINNEETTHFAMVQHPNPQKILIISNAVFGITDEILKYHPNTINIIEQNKYLIEIDKKYYKHPNNPRKQKSNIVNFIINDPKTFLVNHKNLYDVIILNTPFPLTAQFNRFFTLEFFQLLKNHLTTRGIIALKMPPTENYIGKNSIKSQSIIYNTLKSVFKNVIIIPTSSNHFIASDSILTHSIVKETESRKIETKYTNKFYLNEFSILQRADFIKASLDTNAEINTYFKPVAFYSNIDYFLSYFETNKIWIIIALIIIFLIIIFRLNTLDFVILSTGYALMLSEIILIFSFQILFGNLYQIIGILFALFMLGISSGAMLFHIKSYSISSLNSKKATFSILLALAALLTALPLIKLSTQFILSEYLIYTILFTLIFTISFLAGAIFTNLSLQYKSNNSTISARLYSADLFGSAFGAILPSCFLLPILGIELTSYTASTLLLLSLVLFALKK